MSNFLSFLGPAVSGIQSILGLFGAEDAQRQAQEAAQQAILQFKSNASAAYNDTASAGHGNLYALSGQLSQQLQRQGGALGQALANAGVYNSSAAAGALANQGAQNAGVLGAATTNLGDQLNQLKNQTGMEAAQMQFGLNQNNLNYARQQTAQAQGGIGSFLGALGQMSNQFAGGGSAGVAGSGNAAIAQAGQGVAGMGLPAQAPSQTGPYAGAGTGLAQLGAKSPIQTGNLSYFNPWAQQSVNPAYGGY